MFINIRTWLVHPAQVPLGERGSRDEGRHSGRIRTGRDGSRPRVSRGRPRRGRPEPASASARPWRVVAWDGATLGDWQREIDGCDVVINLAGRSVNCRTRGQSRGDPAVARAVDARGWTRRSRGGPAAARLAASEHRHDLCASIRRPNDEHSGILGGDEPNAPDSWRFSIDVARAWERAFEEAVTERNSEVALRSAMTLSPDRGGVFDTLLGLARHGLGGSAGHGRQFMSWIHYEDFVRRFAG